MERTVIERLADNHIVVTRETPRGIPGNSKQRKQAKKRDEYKSDWRKLARKIFRHGTVEAYADAGITCLPGDPEIAAQARANDYAAYHYAKAAEETVYEIKAQVAQFAVAPPRKVRVTITVEE
jgi:predicted trehalose synthase